MGQDLNNDRGPFTILKLQPSPDGDGDICTSNGDNTAPVIALTNAKIWFIVNTQYGPMAVDGLEVRTGENVREVIEEVMQEIDFSKLKDEPDCGLTPLGFKITKNP